MAKSENNVLTHGMSGKIGDLLVFRNVNGKTIVSKAPAKPKGEPSEKQQQHRERFQEAVIYGKTVQLTPELKALYESSLTEGQSIYQVALADFLKAPAIKQVDVNHYTGAIGSTLSVRVTDDFMVKAVHVAIVGSNGDTLEQGEALCQPNGLDWLYTATTNHTPSDGNKIVITASDTPGNLTRSETAL